MDNKIGIVIQARMGSTRLPGKIMKKMGKKNILEHILFRLSYLKHNTVIVIATTNSSKDGVVEEFCHLRNIECFRGSEENVLERYYLSAKKYDFEHIVRLTADNPFTDIEELDNLIDMHINTNADYSSSLDVLPVGIGAEIFTFASLEKSYLEGKAPHHLEHVDEYILENKDKFKISVLKVADEKRRPDLNFTVDTKEDYEKACRVISLTKNEFIGTEEIIKLGETVLAGKK